MQNNFETINHFYLELINRFFHPKSYFYFCISNSLENRSSHLENLDEHSIRVISNFIKYLVESPQPALELKEITQIQSYNNFYSELEERLLQLNLKSLDQPQLKEAIKNYANFFMAKLVQIVLSDSNSRATLEKYLNIKSNLRSMLKSSGLKSMSDRPATTNHLKVIRSQRVDTQKIKEHSLPKAKPKPNPVRKSSTILGSNVLQGFFEEEIFELLKPLTKMSSQTPNFLNNKAALNICFESFHNIKEVSMYHGYDEIEAIASRVVKIVNKFRNTNQLPEKAATQLITEAKTVIEKYVFHHHPASNFKELLKKYDSFIDGEIQESAIDVPPESPSPQVKESESASASVAESPAIEKTDDSDSNQQENGKKIELPTPIVSENDDNIDKDLLEFKLPGEEDEELMNLLQEIAPRSAQKGVGEKTEFAIEHPADDNTNGNDSSSDGDHQESAPVQEEDKSENLIDSFYKEANLYYKIILNALTQLSDNRNYSTSLEDIELASASLNHLAQKFGLDKIAFLPELMESICVQANKRKMALPVSIIENMGNGISLLKKFNRENTEHKIQFISILTNLKEYYLNTFGKQGIRFSSEK